MEVASCIAKTAKSVMVVGMEKVPFERVLGVEVGTALQKVPNTWLNPSYTRTTILSSV